MSSMKAGFDWRRYMLALGLLLAASACTDGAPSPTATVSGAGAPANLNRSSSPYGCFISKAVEGLPYAYAYSQLPVEFPREALAADGGTLKYQFRLEEPGKSPVLLANCVIPRTRLAVRILEARLRVTKDARYQYTDRAKGDITIMEEGDCASKVGDIYDEKKTCFTLETITAVGRPPTGPGTGSPPDATTGPIVSTEPTEHAGGGTGGQAPCWNCSYGDPMLVCTAQVRRGDTVTCSSNITDELTTRVIRWRWADTSHLSVEETNPDMIWSGMAVHGGTVTLTIEDSQGVRELMSSFEVTNRGWRWDNTKWSFVQGGAQVCESMPAAVPSFVLGWNRSRSSCDGPRVDPDPRRDPTNGYTIGRVPSGPNNGVWYVTSASYRMDRGSNLNPNALPGGARFLVSDPAQAQECRNGGMTGTQVYANFFEFNKYCKGVAMDAFLSAAWAHEGFGTTGANGHESVARVAAATLQFDPYAAIEPLVAGEEAHLRAGVLNQAFERGAELSNYSAAHSNGASGNWSGVIWLYDPNSGSFVSATHTM